ncbi:hypothetical protein OZX62_06155 [Bifidobacterium sp. ESL0690]|uniref:hypothetical protein n=1 Tax=Bifidobacterium sp. ESL0690 TaxID=2983214 RepID=UPI0023F9F82E|nr:hypothetical protein [Bifidobacterium sp. ESL0690]WEV46045.1 hypothetical protein OZX62_06155 [Bifidobacterium sp. ESL0690]
MDNIANPPLPSSSETNDVAVPLPPKVVPKFPTESVAVEQKVVNDKDLNGIDKVSKNISEAKPYQTPQQEQGEKVIEAKKSKVSETGKTKKKHHSVGDIILYVVYGVITSALGIALLVCSDGDTAGILVGLALLAYGLWVFSGAFTGGWRPIFYIVG